MKHAISWFEIPTTNLNRATTFYETIFGISFSPLDMPNIQMRMFPVESMTESVGGALVYSGGFHLSSETHGPLVYLNGDPDLQLVLDKVEAAGGKILVPKTEISPDHGFMAVIVDTEGNRIALHSSPVA